MAQGAYAKAFNSKVDVERTLANEIIAAYKMDVQASGALSKKLDLERQSDASR
jgi:ribosomal protein S7